MHLNNTFKSPTGISMDYRSQEPFQQSFLNSSLKKFVYPTREQQTVRKTSKING